jgi:hypothetical protein
MYALVISVFVLSVVGVTPSKESYRISRIDSSSKVNSDLEHVRWSTP